MSTEAERVAFKEKLRSLSLMGPRSERAPKTTVDVHDTHKVEVMEHWSDRVDVGVKMDTVRLKGPNAEPVT